MLDANLSEQETDAADGDAIVMSLRASFTDWPEEKTDNSPFFRSVSSVEHGSESHEQCFRTTKKALGSWLVDSGATCHITSAEQLHLYHVVFEHRVTCELKAANGAPIQTRESLTLRSFSTVPKVRKKV